MVGLLKSIGNFFNARLLLVALIACLGTGSYSYYLGGKHCRQKHEVEEAREERLYQKMLQATAEEIAKIDIVNKTTTEVLEREIRKEPVYLDCEHSDDALRMLNAILTGEAEPSDFD